MLFELQLGRVSKVWAPEHIRDKNLTKLNAGQVRKKWKFISQFLQLVRWSVNLTIPPFKNMNIKQRRKKICFNQTLWEDLTAVQLHLPQSQLYNQLFQQQAAEKQSKAALKLPGCRPHTGAITHQTSLSLQMTGDADIQKASSFQMKSTRRCFYLKHNTLV